jgi:rubrerythrin
MLDATDARLLVVDDDEAARAAGVRRDSKCSRCGYGVAVAPPPFRCPMCNRIGAWRYVGDSTYEPAN